MNTNNIQEAQRLANQIRLQYERELQRQNNPDYLNSLDHWDDIKERQIEQRKQLDRYYQELEKTRREQFITQDDYKFQKALDEAQWLKQHRATAKTNGYEASFDDNGNIGAMKNKDGYIAYMKQEQTERDYLDFKRKQQDLDRLEKAYKEEQRKLNKKEEDIKRAKVKLSEMFGPNDAAITALDEQQKKIQQDKLNNQMIMDHERRIVQDYTEGQSLKDDLDKMAELEATKQYLHQTRETKMLDDLDRQREQIKKIEDRYKDQINNLPKDDNKLEDLQQQQQEEIQRNLQQKKIDTLWKLRAREDDEKRQKQIEEAMEQKILDMQKSDLKKLNYNESNLVKGILEKQPDKQNELKIIDKHIKEQEEKMRLQPKMVKYLTDKPATLPVSGAKVYGQDRDMVSEQEQQVKQKQIENQIKEQEQGMER